MLWIQTRNAVQLTLSILQCAEFPALYAKCYEFGRICDVLWVYKSLRRTTRCLQRARSRINGAIKILVGLRRICMHAAEIYQLAASFLPDFTNKHRAIDNVRTQTVCTFCT